MKKWVRDYLGIGCCGATNRCCSIPPGVMWDTPTGCEKCGHSKGCHAYVWADKMVDV